eukprot:TRINITY_DN37605_c0_g1_i1.p2 TRINITY_DN37605_c0_g1~~TRINITY_DN37605_c0_g1_i1.p2  ORF type:complete len:167 (+),score=42.53 TRINITY_DN37605_c0_g1_i1:45-503(+)
MTQWSEKYVMLGAGMPAFWFTIMHPHFVKVYHGVKGGKPRDLLAEPRKFFEEKSNEDTPEAAIMRRAAAAHQNGWEAFVLYLSAVVAAYGAKVDPESFNNHCALALAFRVAFNLLYIYVTDGRTARLRSLSFFGHVFTCFSLHYKAYRSLVA